MDAAQPATGSPRLAVIGGGPAGLMAAEAARAAGLEVDVYEAKGSVGRKFLIAGKGGLNLTHSDPPDLFASRFRERAGEVADWLSGFDAEAVRRWAAGLGIETFVGSSGRVFPQDMKAAPLLRGWVRRLRESGVRFHVHHRWTGWDDEGAWCFASPDGDIRVRSEATVLALGGGSWPQLGSDGAWQALLAGRSVDVAPLRPANCGFDVDWSAHLVAHHAGAPLKPVVAYRFDAAGQALAQQGECVVSEHGIEGSLVYAWSGVLREAIEREGSTTLYLDLAPGRSLVRLQQDLSRPRGRRSLAEHLRRQAGIGGVKAALLYEVLPPARRGDPLALAQAIHRLPLVLRRPRPMAEAISSAGGVRLEALDERLMLRGLPGVFCAGEMLDWEAPTGGYLLTACLSSGRLAGQGAADWVRSNP